MSFSENPDQTIEIDEKNYAAYTPSIINYISKFFKSSLVLLGFAFLFLYLAFNTAHFFPTYLGEFDGQKIVSIIFIIIFAFLVCFILPAVASKFVLREDLKDLGLSLPENKTKASFLIVVALLLLVPLLISLTKRPEFQLYYSLKQPSLAELAFLNVFLFPCYYFSEEFFYRGFLFLGLWRRVKWHSFWITDLFFAFAHLGKPGMEILLSMFASVVFNVITLNTKSIYPAMIVHWTMGTTLIILINFHHL